jgi:hypothetical protein
VPINVSDGDRRLANSLLRAIAPLGPEGLSRGFDGEELAALLGRPVTPGAVQEFNKARRDWLDEHKPLPAGGVKDRFGGEAKGLFGIHLFGNPETAGYKGGERLGGLATDVTLGTTCVILSVGTCAAAGGSLFASRTVGVGVEGGGAKKMAKGEVVNAVKTGLGSIPGGALGILPPAAKIIETGGPMAGRIAEARKQIKATDKLIDAAKIKVGSHTFNLHLKAHMELTGGAGTQAFDQAKSTAEKK